jgi:hypothetical protein
MELTFQSKISTKAFQNVHSHTKNPKEKSKKVKAHWLNISIILSRVSSPILLDQNFAIWKNFNLMIKPLIKALSTKSKTSKQVQLKEKETNSIVKKSDRFQSLNTKATVILKMLKTKNKSIIFKIKAWIRQVIFQQKKAQHLETTNQLKNLNKTKFIVMVWKEKTFTTVMRSLNQFRYKKISLIHVFLGLITH